MLRDPQQEVVMAPGQSFLREECIPASLGLSSTMRQKAWRAGLGQPNTVEPSFTWQVPKLSRRKPGSGKKTDRSLLWGVGGFLGWTWLQSWSGLYTD